MLCSFGGVVLSLLFLALIFLHLLLGVCGNNCWLSPLMTFIFGICVCGLVECLFLQWLFRGMCWVGQGAWVSGQGWGRSLGDTQDGRGRFYCQREDG